MTWNKTGGITQSKGDGETLEEGTMVAFAKHKVKLREDGWYKIYFAIQSVPAGFLI